MNENITNLKSNQVAAKGLVRTFQANILFQEYTVLENILIGCQLQVTTGMFMNLFNIKSVRKSREKINKIADGIIEFVGLKDLRQDRERGSWASADAGDRDCPGRSVQS